MSIDNLTIGEIKKIKGRLTWTPDRKSDGELWMVEARKVRDEYGLSDKDVLDIVNNRLKF